MIRSSTSDLAFDSRSTADGVVFRTVHLVKAMIREVGRTYREVNRMRNEAAARYPFIQD